MFRFLIIFALTVLCAIPLADKAAHAESTKKSSYSGHRLNNTDILVTTSNDLLPAQIIQLAPEHWQQTINNPFKINFPAPANTYSQRWLKLPIRNSNAVTAHYRLVIAQPILSETQVYIGDKFDYQSLAVNRNDNLNAVKSLTLNRNDNVNGVSSYSFAIEPIEKKDIYIKTQFGLNVPQISLLQEENYQRQNHQSNRTYQTSIGIISILLLLVIVLQPSRLINPFFLVFNLALIALWATLNGQWLSDTTPLWLTKLILSSLVISAALARYQRFSARLIAIKRLIIAAIIAGSLWFIPTSYSLLSFIALPIALLILILNAIEPSSKDNKSNKYSRWELIFFLCLGSTGIVVTSLALTNVFGYTTNLVNLNQALQITIILNLIMLVLSCILRLKYDLSSTVLDQQFTKNLQHQITQQHAAISQLTADLKISQDRLKIDELTGLRNRDYFDIHLEQEINRTRRHSFPISLLMIKFNGLYNITEHYDYEMSNKFLQQIAISCHAQLKRSSDKICRYHDDVFALILPDTHSAGATHLGQVLLGKINDSLLAIDKNQLAVSVSIGVVTGVSGPELTAAKLTETAESALQNTMEPSESQIAQIIINQDN